MRRIIVLVVSAGALCLVAATPARACRFPSYATAAAQSEAADVVFTGRVMGVERRRLDQERVLVITRFRVDNAIKGRQELEREVVQAILERPLCGTFRRFEVGETYLVLAMIGEDGVLSTSGYYAPQFSQAEFEVLKPTQ